MVCDTEPARVRVADIRLLNFLGIKAIVSVSVRMERRYGKGFRQNCGEAAGYLKLSSDEFGMGNFCPDSDSWTSAFVSDDSSLAIEDLRTVPAERSRPTRSHAHIIGVTWVSRCPVFLSDNVVQ
jgi:hypothetical protein